MTNEPLSPNLSITTYIETAKHIKKLEIIVLWEIAQKDFVIGSELNKKLRDELNIAGRTCNKAMNSLQEKELITQESVQYGYNSKRKAIVDVKKLNYKGYRTYKYSLTPNGKEFLKFKKLDDEYIVKLKQEYCKKQQQSKSKQISTPKAFKLTEKYIHLLRKIKENPGVVLNKIIQKDEDDHNLLFTGGSQYYPYAEKLKKEGYLTKSKYYELTTKGQTAITEWLENNSKMEEDEHNIQSEETNEEYDIQSYKETDDTEVFLFLNRLNASCGHNSNQRNKRPVSPSSNENDSDDKSIAIVAKKTR